MASLIGHLSDQLLTAAPFTRSAEGRVYLLHAHPSFSGREHTDALALLVREKLISDFRYIDAIPTPSVIAIRG